MGMWLASVEGDAEGDAAGEDDREERRGNIDDATSNAGLCVRVARQLEPFAPGIDRDATRSAVQVRTETDAAADSEHAERVIPPYDSHEPAVGVRELIDVGAVV